MEQTKLNLADQLKAEIMERYDLREDQVKLELIISTADLEIGRTILHDFDTRFPGKTKEQLLRDNEPCGSVYSASIHNVSVHRKDGFYGTYVVGEDDDI